MKPSYTTMVYKMRLTESDEIGLVGDSPSPSALAFTKLHGNGNDFILIDEIRGEIVPRAEKGIFSMALCNRNFGIGADGVIFLVESSRADVGMRLLQPDGSEAAMCGNGIRCLAKYAWDRGYVGDRFLVDTLAGVLPVEVREDDGVFWAKVDMGIPRFDCPSIPAAGDGELIDVEMEGFRVSAVNTGVPHAVIFVDDLDIPVGDLAPDIRNSEIFPEGANVNFVLAGDQLEIRTFERGIEGETFSCGTGSVAAAAVARQLGLAGDEVMVNTMGGPLMIYFEGDHALLEGPAITVFSGILNDEYRSYLVEGF